MINTRGNGFYQLRNGATLLQRLKEVALEREITLSALCKEIWISNSTPYFWVHNEKPILSIKTYKLLGNSWIDLSDITKKQWE